ncbi:HD domain-containing protein [Streptomyces sp. HNM0574]|uniref:HD domain-containing protein n=1 Tax=Streptomyces sp. HNM0574 TaxID=2714954 RepID=UPI00146A08D9|nr:HD domain-containing protein [Streptomyces sp. HNM0574]NLU70522.1 HD domain-containing protein [Streptomyces sp. HNM0574]
MDDRGERKPGGPDGVGCVPSHVAGRAREFTDPLWRVRVALRPVEAELLRTAPLRRLHSVAHAGASALTTLQTYSRLEHTLGVLALVAHFRPEDEPLRAAALLHDIGHLPLSHSAEGVAGLDHHALGARLLRSDPVRPVLERHGIGAEHVAALLAGDPPSPLTRRSGLLNLDHLDSYVRSGRSAGQLDEDPARLLARLRLADDAVSTDRATAATLVSLVGAEARLHTSWDNVAPVSVVRHLVGRLLESAPLSPAALARMTDAELWSALAACPATRAETARLHHEPHRLHVTTAHAPATARPFALRKIYRSAPLVHGRPLASSAPELARELDGLGALPTEFRVWWD